jgi:hypothetical protein
VATNPYEQFVQPSGAKAGAKSTGDQNIYEQFLQPAPVSPTMAPATVPTVPQAASPNMAAPTGQLDAMPVGRQDYGLTEVPGAAIRNIPASAGRFASGVFEAVTSPVQTAKGAWDMLAGALQNVLPQSAVDWVNEFEGNPEAAERAVNMANAAGGMFKERYGGYENIKRTLAEDPVGAAADLSTLFTGGALLTAKTAPTLSTALSRAATVTDPLSVVTKPAQQLIETKQRILPSTLRKEQEANAVRDATLRAAQGEGYVVTPGSVSPTGRNVVAERLAGKTHLEQLASVRNQEVTDKLARRALGLPENAALTSDNMRSIREQEYAKGYEPVNKIGRVEADAAYMDDLIQIEQKYTGRTASFPGATPEAVEKLITPYIVDGFDAADAVNATRVLRETGAAAFKRGDNDVGKAAYALSNAIENQIERAIMVTKRPDTPNLLEQFRLSRQRMAVSHTVEDAIKEGSGSVIAAKLSRDIQNGKYVSGDIETIAKFANVFPRVTQLPSQIGTPAAGTLLGRSMTGLGAGVGAGGGFMLTGGAGGAGFGAVAGAMAPEFVSAGLRNYLISERGQRNVLPSYRTISERVVSDTAARNALMAYQAQQAAQAGDRQVRDLQPNELGILWRGNSQNQLAR